MLYLHYLASCVRCMVGSSLLARSTDCNGMFTHAVGVAGRDWSNSIFESIDLRMTGSFETLDLI
jgi:hypothetical protein